MQYNYLGGAMPHEESSSATRAPWEGSRDLDLRARRNNIGILPLRCAPRHPLISTPVARLTSFMLYARLTAFYLAIYHSEDMWVAACVVKSLRFFLTFAALNVVLRWEKWQFVQVRIAGRGKLRVGAYAAPEAASCSCHQTRGPELDRL
jgi:hypothetical protein